MLEVTSLDSRYGRIPALSGISLHVAEGELVALVGANGAGKTTLLRTLSGVQPASGGRVVFRDRDLARCTPRRRVQMGMVQVPEGRQVFGPLSVEDNLRLGAFARGAQADLEPMLALFPVLLHKRHEFAGTLSGGQQQLLALARALMARPRLLLLDEPSMGLAPLVIQQIFDIIVEINQQGTARLVLSRSYMALPTSMYEFDSFTNRWPAAST